MKIGSVFEHNRTQVVRLPVETLFDKNNKKVEVLELEKVGLSPRSITHGNRFNAKIHAGHGDRCQVENPKKPQVQIF